eukprot:1173756-Alexandrium_andersonii.AAC.1
MGAIYPHACANTAACSSWQLLRGQRRTRPVFSRHNGKSGWSRTSADAGTFAYAYRLSEASWR